MKHNNAEAAVNALLDGEDISKEEAATKWDDNMFSADREGNDQADRDRSLYPIGATAPPSRAPSRNSMQPTTKDQEDRDMQEAIALSQGVSVPYQQEGGVIKGDGTEKKFGPANKDHYEQNQWAMVRTSPANEVVPDVDVEHRNNVPGDPRLLKHLPDGDYLANFLTICHAIAGAREAMLMRRLVRTSYGQDPDWWRGHQISMPRVVHVENGTPGEPDPDKYDELITEVQRLMAFLDVSERSYASPGALTQAEMIKNTSPSSTKSKTLLELFIEQWTFAATTKIGEMSGFFTTYTANVDNVRSRFPFTDLTTDAPEGEKTDLSELMDGMFWGTDTDDMDASDNHVVQPAEILVMRLRQTRAEATQLRVEVPAEFHMDKYLEENLDATIDARRQIAKGRTRIKKIGEVEKKLTTWKHPKKNEDIDPRVLLKHTHGHFSGQNMLDIAKADRANGVVSADGADAAPPHYEEIAQKLDKVIASIDNKLTVLASEKEKTRKAITEMSRNPHPELEAQLRYRYTLRGVATKPNITYILRLKEEEEDEEMLLGQQEDDTTPDGMQWWRIEYELNASGSGAKITKTKTPDYDVLRAVELEHKEALLVYASDKVNDIILHNSTLPSALQDFVDRDNELFKDELRTATEDVQPPAYDLDSAAADIPRESIERRTSMDSLRAEGGDDVGDGRHSPPSYEDEGFLDHHAFGLGPDIKPGQYESEHLEDAGPVHEIKLDDGDEVMGQGSDMEMVEKVHEPLIPGLGAGGGGGGAGVDEVMQDMVEESQDLGVGGEAAGHHEDDMVGMR